MANNEEKNDKVESIIDKIAEIDNIVDSKLDKSLKDDDLSQLENKITSFKPHFKNLGNNNNVVEFLTKLMFDRNTASIGNRHIDKNKYVQNIIGKEQWSKAFSSEQDRIDRYSDYEIIYSYIPELASAIDSFRDAIISPDSLTDNSVPIKLPEDMTSDEAEVIFANNIKMLNKKYRLTELQTKIVGKTLILGDQFYAVLPYEREFAKLMLKEESEKIKLPPEFLDPSLAHRDDDLKLSESFYNEPIFSELKEVLKEDIVGKKVDINDYYDSVVKDLKHVLDRIKFKNATQFARPEDNYNNTRVNLKDLELKGCIVKELDPRYIVKLEIDGIVLGYIYAARKKYQNKDAKDSEVKDFFSSRVNIAQNAEGGQNGKDELIFNIIAKGIAKKINLGFIEDNKEFKDLLYVLMQNEELANGHTEFVYFEPDEVIHFFVDKEGTYGTSRMAKSLFFAKLYISSILNEQMQKLTRGRDKRVVYVDVGVDEEAEESIQEVVRDIKSKETQTDNLKSLTTILRTTGMFEDYYIPRWDGEDTIVFDTIQGMDVTSDTEWNDNLLKSVIKGTGFPSNYIDASHDVDFARTVIMQNQLLVRKVINDQEIFSELMTDFVRKIYKYEYSVIDDEETDKKDQKDIVAEFLNDEDMNEIHNFNEEIINNMEVRYPTPTSLNLNNTNDQINNASQTIDFIMSSYFNQEGGGMDTEDEELQLKKMKFRRKVSAELVPSIDFDKFDELFDAAGLEAKEDILLKRTVQKQDDFDDFGGDDFGGGGMDFGGQAGGDMGMGGDPFGGAAGGMDMNAGGGENFDQFNANQGGQPQQQTGQTPNTNAQQPQQTGQTPQQQTGQITGAQDMDNDMFNL